MSPKYTTPQWLHPRPRRLARLRIPGSHPKTNIVTHQTMEDLPVTFVGNDEGIYSFNNTWFCSFPCFFWQDAKKVGEILPLKKISDAAFPRRCPNGAKYLGFWTPTWALGKYQVHGLHGLSCLAGTRFSVSNHLDHLMIDQNEQSTNLD